MRWHLTFHGVGVPPRPLDPGEAHVWLEEDRFIDVLDAVRGRSDVSVTFDDGNRSDVEIALPALAARGLRGRFFAVAGRVGEEHFLDDSALRELAGAGMVVGSHGMRHVDWRRADLAEELGSSRRVLGRHAGVTVEEAAAPFGAYSRRVLRAARRFGYRRLYTSDGAPARDGAFLQSRWTVSAGDDGASVRERLDRRPTAREHLAWAAKRQLKSWR